MPRLRNVKTGVVVNVSEALAARLDGYEPIAEKPAEKKPTSSRRPAKKTE